MPGKKLIFIITLIYNEALGKWLPSAESWEALAFCAL